MASIYDWSSTASSNATADSGINWQEGQAPSTVNDSARTMMKRLKDFITDIGGSIVAGGTANAVTLTAATGFTAYADGLVVAFKAGADNTGAVTVNVNSIGAKAIRKFTQDGEAALGAGDLQEDGVYILQYSADANAAAGGWLLLNPSPPIAWPVGSVLDYAGASAPTGWLFCYGQAISRTTYAALFAILSTTYGAGDGSTTFNLPDLRGRVVAGKDDMGGSSANRLTNQSGGLNGDVLGASGGAETHQLTSGEMAAHTHSAGTLATASSGAHTHDVTFNQSDANGNAALGGTSSAANETRSGAAQSAGAHTHTIAGSTGSIGSDTAHNNVQPTFILNKIIKI